MRFGHLGQLLPKSLLPVTESETLLSRNLDHLYQARIREVVISTSPENFLLLKPFVERYDKLAANSGFRSYPTTVFSNPLHKISSLAALGEIISNYTRRKYLMTFGDMFFSNNPYLAIGDLAVADLNLVGAYAHPDENDIQKGGLVLVRDGECKRFFLRPSNTLECEGLQCWSGITMLTTEVAEDLREFVRTPHSPIEEDFINFSISKGRRFCVYEVDRFINVNTYSDYIDILTSQL